MNTDFERLRGKQPIAVLFVCLGNICRSPAADGIMHRLVEQQGLETLIKIDSAGTYGGHAGSLPDHRMRQHASKRGYQLTHCSRRVTTDDFYDFDIIVAMDDQNYYNLMRLAPTLEHQQHITKMTDFLTNHTADHVPDPYYEGAEGFEIVLDLLEDACQGLLDQITKIIDGI